eukprot:SAG11_NODE_228_length_11986_cov_128.901153_7_plen_90_part_00
MQALVTACKRSQGDILFSPSHRMMRTSGSTADGTFCGRNYHADLIHCGYFGVKSAPVGLPPNLIIPVLNLLPARVKILSGSLCLLGSAY